MKASKLPLEHPFFQFHSITQRKKDFEPNALVIARVFPATKYESDEDLLEPLSYLSAAERRAWQRIYPELKWVEHEVSKVALRENIGSENDTYITTRYDYPAHFQIDFPVSTWVTSLGQSITEKNLEHPTWGNFDVIELQGVYRAPDHITVIVRDGLATFPANPTAEEMQRECVARLCLLSTGESRSNFLNWHLSRYRGTPTAFIEHIGQLCQNEVLLGSTDSFDVRKWLWTWYEENRAVAKSLGRKLSPKNSRKIHRPLALSLYYRLKSGDRPFRDGSGNTTIEAIKNFGEDNGVKSGHNFYQRGWLGIESENERLKVPDDILSAIELLAEYPAAQELARAEWKHSTEKK